MTSQLPSEASQAQVLPDIRNQPHAILAAAFAEWQQPAYRMEQLLGWLYPRRATSWDSMTNLPRGLRDRLAERWSLGRLELVRRILIPAALPMYVTGLRGGLGLAWMFVVAAEVMGASKGLGFLLLDGQQTGRASLILASILLFALLGKLSDLLLVQLSRPFLHWQDSHSLQPA